MTLTPKQERCQVVTEPVPAPISTVAADPFYANEVAAGVAASGVHREAPIPPSPQPRHPTSGQFLPKGGAE